MTSGKKDNGQHVGEKNGELELINFLGFKENNKKLGKMNRALYLAKCNCGNDFEIVYDQFKRGDKISCGCRRGAKFGLSSKTLGNHYSNYKKGAKQRKYSFDLTIEEFKDLVTDKCAYCGENPVLNLKTIDKEKCYVFNGIDRVNSNFGYSVDNCVSCCSKCNYAKRSMTIKEFLAWLKQAARYVLDNEFIKNEKTDVFNTPYNPDGFYFTPIIKGV